jgi:hypothetical protein
MDIVIIEIDLGKNSCSLAGMDALGRVVLRGKASGGGGASAPRQPPHGDDRS